MDGSSQGQPSAEYEELREAREKGDDQQIARVFERYRDRLRRMVQFRLDRRLQRRVDPSDVIQETYVEAAGRIDDYLREPANPLFLWLRFLTAQKLMQFARHHFDAKMRDARREVPIGRSGFEQTSSVTLAQYLVAQNTSPSLAAVRSERQAILLEALEGMAPLDREILALRHFEQLSNAETAEVLGLNESTASTRYLRALKRIREILARRLGPKDSSI